MRSLKPFLFGLAAALIFGLGIFAGYKIFAPKPGMKTTVNAQAILTALHDRGFLVTQTFIFDTPVTIERSTGSAFKDFFLGQTIEARGTMEVNMGIDLAQVKEGDVTVTDDTVTVRVPSAALFNTRLVGPIEVRNKQGILKRVLDNNDGYNEALSALAKAAEDAATKPELVSRATDHAKEDISRLVEYVAIGKMVTVEVK
jgi:hypothetical protein